MTTHEDNLLLCQVEGQALAGPVVRRHWIPVCLAKDLRKAYGKPVKARTPRGNWVFLSDAKARVGVVHEKCPHRYAATATGFGKAVRP